jgi:uncharacterized membrane protein YoaK (UPF0700 family)
MKGVLPNTPRARTKAAVALGLTFVAGLVDIASYIAVYHLFVAHMTGDTVHLGHNLVIGDWSKAAEAATVIGAFIFGSIVGRSVIEAGARRRIKRAATITLLMEATLILILVWSTPPDVAHRPESLSTIYWTLALLAAAMGMQTATVTRIGALTIHTTFVTGMLNKLAQSISQWLFSIHDEWGQQVSWRERLRHCVQHPSLGIAGFMLGIWICYLVGSLAGAWMSLHWNTRSLYVPVAMLAIAAGIDQVRPLSLEEEKDQF